MFYGVRGVSGCKTPIPETARRIVEAGFGVEVLVANHWAVKEPVSEATIEQLAGICRVAKFMTIHATLNTWSPERFRSEILTAQRIGVPLMIIHPYVLGLDIEGCNPAADEVRDLCKFARDHGVHLALENLGKTGVRSLRRAIDIVGDDSGLGICIDVGHAHRSCTLDGIRPEAFLAEFRGVIAEVHVDDNYGDKDLHLPPGQGTIDWPPVVEAMRRLPEDAIVCLEIAAPERPIETLHESREFLLCERSIHV